jgi:hypothetical protein
VSLAIVIFCAVCLLAAAGFFLLAMQERSEPVKLAARCEECIKGTHVRVESLEEWQVGFLKITQHLAEQNAEIIEQVAGLNRRLKTLETLQRYGK